MLLGNGTDIEGLASDLVTMRLTEEAHAGSLLIQVLLSQGMLWILPALLSTGQTLA